MTDFVGETVIVLVDWEKYGFRCIHSEGNEAFVFPTLSLKKFNI